LAISKTTVYYDVSPFKEIIGARLELHARGERWQPCNLSTTVRLNKTASKQ